jgi:hypothetical protein
VFVAWARRLALYAKVFGCPAAPLVQTDTDRSLGMLVRANGFHLQESEASTKRGVYAANEPLGLKALTECSTAGRHGSLIDPDQCAISSPRPLFE